MSASSSIRNHRIIIASLFLPNTIVLGPEEPDYYYTHFPSHTSSYRTTQVNTPVGDAGKLEDVKSGVTGTEEGGINVPDVVLKLQKDKTKPVLVSKQIQSAHPHLPSSALGTPGTPSIVANAPSAQYSTGTSVIPTLTSSASTSHPSHVPHGATSPGPGVPMTSTAVPPPPAAPVKVDSIIEDLKGRTTARKTSAGLSASLGLSNLQSGTTTPLPLRSPTLEVVNPFSKPGSGTTTGTATPAMKENVAKESIAATPAPHPHSHLQPKAHTVRAHSPLHTTHHAHSHHRSPLSRMGSHVVQSPESTLDPQTNPAQEDLLASNSPPPLHAHRTLSKRTFRRKPSTASNASAQRSKSKSKGQRRTPGVGSVASAGSISSIASIGSASSIEGLDTHTYSPGSEGDLSASITSDSGTFYEGEDEGHAEEIEEEEDPYAFHVEPNSHCNGGLKNAVDSVSAFPSAFGGPTSPISPGAGSRSLSTGFTPSHTRGSTRRNTGTSISGLSTDIRDRPLRQKVWIGTLGTHTDPWDETLKDKVETTLRSSHESEVVWVEDSTFEGCYDEFCHQVLWPALHYTIPDAPRTKLFYESASWKQYLAVNRAFAEKIASVWKEGDVVWVNDYHLMLVPRMLRGLGVRGAIGFFLHVAFPSSEIFRCLSVRVPLLKGILGADLVGFQTANYARHFRQTCSRILSVEALPRGVQLGAEDDDEDDVFDNNIARLPPKLRGKTISESDSDDNIPKVHNPYTGPSNSDVDASSDLGRFVSVGVFPMGIDVGRLKERRKSPEVQEWVDLLKQRYKGMKLVVGRDKLDDIQGVRQKVQAFEVFLEKHPEWVGRVVLIQIALPSPPPPTTASGSSASYALSSLSDGSGATSASTDVTSAILSNVAHINSKFSSLTYQPVIFLHTAEVDWNQYLALLSVADAFLVTSLREGMALRTHEFVAVQEGRGRGKPEEATAPLLARSNTSGELPVSTEEEEEKEGTLILSEFTGSYSYSGFRSCIAINPWDARGTAAAIAQALDMSKEEARSRWEDLNNHVTTQTAQAFVRGFLGRCVRAGEENRALGSGNSRKQGRKYSVSSRGDDEEEDERREAEEVDTRKVKGKWRHARRRLVLVDWEGTLVGDWLPIPKALQLQRQLGLSRVSSRTSDPTSPISEPDQEKEEKMVKEIEEKELRKEEEFQRAIETLRKLAAEEKRNEVWVLSGLPVKGVLDRLERELGDKVGIVAENGCFIKTRSVSSGTQQQEPQWLNMVANLNMTWKSSCLEILNYFTERTPGSFVEERAASVVWRYWTGPTDDSADRQWARRQAAEAQNHIFDSLGERYGLRIIPGTNSFLVLPNNISRSSAVGAILHPGGPAHSPLIGRAAWMGAEMDLVPVVPEEWDFVLAVSGDEKLLRRLGELDESETVTISTSGKATDARWRMGRGQVGEVLGELASA